MNNSRVDGRHIATTVTAICLAIVLVPMVAWAAAPTSRITKVKGTVNIGNFPATQNVSGNVSVGNLPAVQHVDGTVNVGNLPSTQQVTGTISVGNTISTTTADTTSLLFDGAPDGTTFLTPNIVTSGDAIVRINFDNAAPAPAAIRVLSLNPGQNSATTLDDFTIPASSFHAVVYQVPGSAISIYAYGGVTNVHIQVFGRP